MKIPIVSSRSGREDPSKESLMNTIRSILVVLDRNPASADALAKAHVLARSCGARIELFMCEAERAYALSQSYIPAGVAEARQACVEGARRYLAELRAASGVTDMDVSIEARCESPHYESIVRKVMRSKPDLVIKSAGGSAGPGSLDTTDWQLMRACPTTLMLARGVPWATRPHFVAAVDVSSSETEGLTAAILDSAGILAHCAGAELDVAYAQSPRELSGSNGPQDLAKLARPQSGTGLSIHVLSGTPEEKLAGFARARHCDAMLLGALTHRPGLTAQVGTLTSRLVEELACDLILVKPVEFVSPFEQVPGEWSSQPLLHENARLGRPSHAHVGN